MESVLARGWRVPFTASLVVNAEECLRLIDQMRIGVPSAIKESERMMAERDKILEDARTQARNIVAQAQVHAQDMISEQGMMAAAEEEAQQIIELGRTEANRMMQEAEDYVVAVLGQLGDQLRAMLQQAENGIQAIEDSRNEIEPDNASVPNNDGVDAADPAVR